MRNIVVENKYKKDMKKVQRYPKYKESKLKKELETLQTGGTLPDACDDHKAAGSGGQYDGYRIFHHAPNICVIYKITKDELILHRIGSHQDLELTEALEEQIELIEEKEPIYLIRGTSHEKFFPEDKDIAEEGYFGEFYCGIDYKNIFNKEEFDKNLENYTNEYGLVKLYKLSPQAKIYQTSNMIEAIINLDLFDFKSKILEKYYNRDTFKRPLGFVNRTYDKGEFKGVCRLNQLFAAVCKADNIDYNEDIIKSEGWLLLNTPVHKSSSDIYGIYQGILYEYLSKEGYDGIHYNDEYDDVRNQYQIWNNNVVIPVAANSKEQISGDERKLALAVDHALKYNAPDKKNIKKAITIDDNTFLSRKDVPGFNSLPEIDMREIEDEIISKLKLHAKDISDMSQRDADAYINYLIVDGVNKKLFFKFDPVKAFILKSIVHKDFDVQADEV